MRYYHFILLLVAIAAGSSATSAQDLPSTLPDLPFHLVARPLQPTQVSATDYLNVLEDVCEVAASFVDSTGALIDPYLGREHQYSTPYFAMAVGTLLHAGRAGGLREIGIAAMEHATKSFAGGSKQIPDAHGEFFIAPLVEALELYHGQVDEAVHERWKERLRTPLSVVMRNFTGRINNWRTYAMKGEWMRAKAGLIDKEHAVAFIEEAWHQQTQRTRIATDKWNLYQDWSSDPQSHAVEAVGRGNLLALIAEGYDGPSAYEIARFVDRGSRTALLLQAPDGQAPTNGRTDNHVFNDVLQILAFDVMAERSLDAGDSLLAAQYRRAASLAFQSIARWKRTADGWNGSYFITKNHFDPAERVGYQPASQWGNYTGALIMHLAEAYLARQSDIAERPVPTEIGGYAFETDHMFSTFFANAGGMQVVANLRGASVPKYGLSWTPFGVVRFAKVGWDARLGPSDGEHDRTAGVPVSFSSGAGETADDYRLESGVTFGPTWLENGQWVRIADLHTHYRATPEIEFVHPLLVKFSLTYSYVTGRGGPFFKHSFIVTPDGVFTSLQSPQDQPFGLTIPLLENDGRPLQTGVADGIAGTRYDEHRDSQHFIGLNIDPAFSDGDPLIQSTYGWLRPLRYESTADAKNVFVYPRSPGQPTANDVRESFVVTENGFESALGRVDGHIYVGLTSAGGEGRSLDLDGDGEMDIEFDERCRFMLQREGNTVIAVETDRNVSMRYNGETHAVNSNRPLILVPGRVPW